MHSVRRPPAFLLLAAMIPAEVRKWGEAVKRSGARVD